MKYTTRVRRMLPSSGWLYLGSREIWESAPRLTIPNCVFDEYGVLSRNRGAWLIHEEEIGRVRLTNKAPRPMPHCSAYVELSEPGDGSRTRYFTIRKQLRKEYELDDAAVETIPDVLQSESGLEIHFVSATELVSGDHRTMYLFSLDDLEAAVTDTSIWADDPKSLARLNESSASHLLKADDVTEKQRTSQREPKASGSRIDELRSDLDIEAGDVPDAFTIEETTLEIADISPDVYSDIDLKYLLVTYGLSDQTEQNPAENPELTGTLNKPVDVETTYSERDHKIQARVPFCTHDRHAAEFKLFAEVDDANRLEEIKDEFAASPSCPSASISDSLKDRVYMLHEDFLTIETDRGFINNVLYPQ